MILLACLQPDGKIFFRYNVFSSNWPSIHHNDKAETRFFSKNIEEEKLKHHTDTSILTPCDDAWNLAQVPPICLDLLFLHLDRSPPVVNSIDLTWFGTAYICLIKVSLLTMHIGASHEAMRSKELPAVLRDKIVSRQRSREGCKTKQKIFCCTESPQELSGLYNWNEIIFIYLLLIMTYYAS